MSVRIFSLLLFFFMGEISLVASSVMSIQVKQAVVKSAPSFLSNTVITLFYGNQVTVIEEKGDWAEVKIATKKGWIHNSALSAVKLSLNAGMSRAASGVSSSEVMMAGKGFSSVVEAQYRRENPTIRFDLVDQMEKSSVLPESVRVFAADGKLKQ